MSGFIHGGSALTLDIGVRNGTGAIATRGQLVQLDLATAGPPAATGFTAIVPPAGGNPNGWAAGVLDAGSGFFSVTGTVIAPVGHQIMADEEMTVRIGGNAEAVVTGGAGSGGGGAIVIGDLLDVNPGNSDLVGSGLIGGNLDATNAACGLVRGIALEAVPGGQTNAVTVWLRPFGGV